jgi:hypothetical protein
LAKEIRLTINLAATKGSLTVSRNVTVQPTMTGTHMSYNVQNIGFSAHEQIVVNSDVATQGLTFFRNLDATNYVSIGVVVSAAFYPLLRLMPGEIAAVRLEPGVAVYAKAHTAATDLENLDP